MGTQMLTDEIQALHNCRLQLLECVAEPIDIESYRDDISRELGVANSMLKELQETKERESQLSNDNEQGIISRLVLALRGKHVRSARINCLHPMSNELEIRPGVHLNSRLCLPRGL